MTRFREHCKKSLLEHSIPFYPCILIFSEYEIHIQMIFHINLYYHEKNWNFQWAVSEKIAKKNYFDT